MRLGRILVLAILLVPTATEAQPSAKVPRVGYLNAVAIPSLLAAFTEGLRDHGWRDRENIVIESRAAGGRVTRIPALTEELVRLKVDVLVLTATSIRDAKASTGRTPVVFAIADDPVRAGLVASLARPGGRMTGITSLNIDLDAKRLELLKSALPGVSRVAVLTTPQDPALGDRVATVERAARVLGLQLQILETSRGTLEAAFDAATRARAGAVMVLGSPSFFSSQRQMAELAMRSRLPTISAWREFAEAGGLLAYGTNVPAMFRRAASYVDRILKGANPGDLPVEQADTFELTINAKAARMLNVDIPQVVQTRADHVVQ